MIATPRTPFIDLGFRQSPPRIISEIKKPTPAKPRDHMQTRISGELLCYLPNEGGWRARRVSVRCGQLQVGPTSEGDSSYNPKLALRRLNLTPGPNAHSFALRITQDAPPVLTLQASNQREFDLWVRTIAIELIRQTPLDAVKYLDILNLTSQVQSTPKSDEKDLNHNSIPPADTFRRKSLNFNKLDENRNICNNLKSHDSTTSLNCEPPNKFLSLNIPNTKIPQNDEQTVEILLKKCQNADSYVPVKEKLKLFESLCRLGRINNDESENKYNNKRTRSLHDLSNSEYPVQPNAGVKQICKYFENKNDENKEKDPLKFNTIARGNRTSFGPVKTIISRKYSIQTKNY